MSELAFVKTMVPLTLDVLAAEAAAPLPPSLDASRQFRAVAALDRAGQDAVSAFVEGNDLDELLATRAGACCIEARYAEHVPPDTIALITQQPLSALSRIAVRMHPRGVPTGLVFDHIGIDRAAIVHRDALLEQGVVLDPGVVVGPGVEIGLGTRVGANSVIAAGVRIGRGCTIDTQVSIRQALIGDRVAIHAGALIGLSDGSTGDELSSLGRVIIQDGATIGANAVVERGNLGDTMIGEGACIVALGFVRAGALIARGEMRAGGLVSASEKMG